MIERPKCELCESKRDFGVEPCRVCGALLCNVHLGLHLCGRELRPAWITWTHGLKPVADQEPALFSLTGGTDIQFASFTVTLAARPIIRAVYIPSGCVLTERGDQLAGTVANIVLESIGGSLPRLAHVLARLLCMRGLAANGAIVLCSGNRGAYIAAQGDLVKDSADRTLALGWVQA